MQIRLSELRQIVREELTKHNKERLKSVVQSALRVAENYVQNMITNSRDDSVTVQDILAVAKEAKSLASWLDGRKEPDAEPMKQVVDILEQLGKSTDPFKRIFGKVTGKQENRGKQLQPLVVKLHKLAYDTWKILMYDEKYQNFDDDTARTTYTYR